MERLADGRRRGDLRAVREACRLLLPPFRARQSPREHVAWAFGDQDAAECRFGEPVVDQGRAAVDWWAVITSNDGSLQTVAGTSLLRSDGAGRVVEQRDAWAGEAGRRDLPAWAR